MPVFRFDHDALVLDDIALGVERNDVGDAERLAGHDQEIAALHRHVGDRRVADDDVGYGTRQAYELRLVVADDEVGGACADGACQDAGARHRGGESRAAQ